LATPPNRPGASPHGAAKIPPPAAPPAGTPSPRASAPAGAVEVAAPAHAPAGGDGKRNVRAPVRETYRRTRHVLILLSLIIFVGVPSAVSGFYLWTVAVDQYTSKVGFTVRREEGTSAVDLLGGLGGFSGASSSDTDILYEFIQSQRLVMEIDQQLDLQAMWSKPEEDFVFALDTPASIEELVAYWGRMVRVSYAAGSGLIEIEVLAFDPADATRISQTLFERSSQMINQLSDIARQDAIFYARKDLDDTLERLKEARILVTQFRNKNQLVNPELDLQSQVGLLGNLQQQQAQALIEVDLLLDTVQPGDTRLVQAERRLRVIQARIEAERNKLGFGETDDGGSALADLVGEYERLVVEREFAERTYVTALASYDSALAESRRKTRYLAAYMEPTTAQTPLYPKRITLFTMFTLLCFLTWSIAVLVIYSIKDRR